MYPSVKHIQHSLQRITLFAAFASCSGSISASAGPYQTPAPDDAAILETANPVLYVKQASESIEAVPAYVPAGKFSYQVPGEDDNKEQPSATTANSTKKVSGVSKSSAKQFAATKTSAPSFEPIALPAPKSYTSPEPSKVVTKAGHRQKLEAGKPVKAYKATGANIVPVSPGLAKAKPASEKSGSKVVSSSNPAPVKTSVSTKARVSGKSKIAVRRSFNVGGARSSCSG